MASVNVWCLAVTACSLCSHALEFSPHVRVNTKHTLYESQSCIVSGQHDERFEAASEEAAAKGIVCPGCLPSEPRDGRLSLPGRNPKENVLSTARSLRRLNGFPNASLYLV